MYRIFCVEDDETIGKMIKKHLEKWDFEVHVAEDLSQIMTEFAAFDPQLVLMDIRLPFYNGLLLVHRDPQSIESAGDLFVLCGRQYEYCYGDEYGRG